MYPAGATPESVFDLTGNVWEWLTETFSLRSYVVARGSYYNGKNMVGAFARLRDDRFFRDGYVGFRLVVVPGSRA